MTSGRCAKNPHYQHDRDAIIKTVAIMQMGGACQRCSYNKYVTALEFHHVDHAEKENDPSQFIRNGNLTLMREELDKCVLLCRNCHMAYHAEEWFATFSKRPGWGWTIDTITDRSRFQWRPMQMVKFKDPMFAELVVQTYEDLMHFII